MGCGFISSLVWGYMLRGISMTDAAAAHRACSCVLALPKAYARKSNAKPCAMPVHVCSPCRKSMQENANAKTCAMLHTAVLQASGLIGRLNADRTCDEGKHPHYTPCPILDGKPHGGVNMPVSRSHAVAANTS